MKQKLYSGRRLEAGAVEKDERGLIEIFIAVVVDWRLGISSRLFILCLLS